MYYIHAETSNRRSTCPQNNSHLGSTKLRAYVYTNPTAPLVPICLSGYSCWYFSDDRKFWRRHSFLPLLRGKEKSPLLTFLRGRFKKGGFSFGRRSCFVGILPVAKSHALWGRQRSGRTCGQASELASKQTCSFVRKEEVTWWLSSCSSFFYLIQSK